MKIYSGNSHATVTLVTSVGIVATVAHFYRGEPLYLEGGIKVGKLRISTKYDYFIGINKHIRQNAKVAFVDLDVGDEVIVRTDHGDVKAKVVQVLSYGSFKRYRISTSFVNGDSGSPIIYDGYVVGYLTHENAFTEIRPLYEGINSVYQELYEMAKGDSATTV